MTPPVLYHKLTKANLNPHALDAFERRQEVNRSWRNVAGEWRVVTQPFVDDWSLEKKRRVAQELLIASEQGGIVHGAFVGRAVIGFIYVSTQPFGSAGQYLELNNMQVSAPYRGQGIGRTLFQLACQDARGLQAKKLYLSAQSSEETQAFYRALGCVLAMEIDQTIAANEPFDVQLEYVL